MNKTIFNTAVAVAVTAAAVFCIGCSEKPDDGDGGGGGTTITYEGETYQTVVIGSQTWMTKNLNYNVSGSVCYENSADSCAKYGRLYDWETAKTACPSGWHLPSDAEWTALENAVGGSSTAGKKLKSTSGWYDNGNGTNDVGFSALPGGLGVGGGFKGAGDRGNWWSATEYDADCALHRNMDSGDEYVNRYSNDKVCLYSVRCVRN